MSASEKQQGLEKQLKEMESQLSAMQLELKEATYLKQEEEKERRFYQLIADFAFGWELWFAPKGEIKYCSPACYDLTGFTANQIIASSGIDKLLVYSADRNKYTGFLSSALNQSLLNQTLEFRILTRTKQLRWCLMSVRGVYDKQGKYLGVRASVQDITRLKNAMGHITVLEKGKEFEHRSKQRLQSELELKDRELVAFLLQLSQKNELIAKAVNLVSGKSTSNEKGMSTALAQLEKMLRSDTVQTLDWDMVESQIEKSHPGFLSRLQSKHPRVTVKDKKLCCYVRLGLSSKEIAGLMNITPKSVEIARVRLRKKLQLTSKNRLGNYISEI